MQVCIIAEECREKRGYEGAAIELPASRFLLEDAFQRAQVSKNGSYQIQQFIQWPGFLSRYLEASREKTLEEVNLLAKKVSQMNEIQLGTYEGALQLRNDENIDLPISTKELINYAYNLDAYEFHAGVMEDRDLGEIAMMGGMLDIVNDLPDDVAELLDARKVGEAIRYADQGAFTTSGYIFRSNTQWQEVYDGIHLPEQPEEHGLISLRLESINKNPNTNNGVWLELPADEQAIQEALTSLGEPTMDYCTIVDVKSVLPSLKYQLTEDADIDKLNLLANRLETFPSSKILMKYKAVLELECFPDINRMLDITQNLDCYTYNDRISTVAGYAEWLLCMADFDTSDPAFDQFDFAGYGERSLEREGAISTQYGVIYQNVRPFVQEFSVISPEQTM